MWLKTSMWLEYQIEANWTSPFIFAVYNIFKPVGGALLLVAMYYVVTGGFMGEDALSFIYVGNTFYMLIAQTLMFIGWVVHDDREHYQTLKYLYISPTSYFKYLIGRSAMRFVLSIFSLIVLILLGIFFQIPYDFNFLLLIITFVIGWIFIISSGLLLSGVNMLTARHGGAVGEALAGIFYLLSGVIFPLSILPLWARNISLVLPSTYWFSLVRRSILGFESDSVMGAYGLTELILIPLAISVFMFFLSYGMFLGADYLARKKGILDMTTTY